VAAAIAPSRISGSLRASLRFHTDNSWPAASKRRAMGVPMLPNPKNPILMFLLSSSSMDDGDE
jgi:hypothetical protein